MFYRASVPCACVHLIPQNPVEGHISEKLVDKESKVVRDRQDDNVLRDLLHCLHGYLTFCGQVYSFNSLLYPEMPSKGCVFTRTILTR